MAKKFLDRAVALVISDSYEEMECDLDVEISEEGDVMLVVTTPEGSEAHYFTPDQARKVAMDMLKAADEAIKPKDKNHG